MSEIGAVELVFLLLLLFVVVFGLLARKLGMPYPILWGLFTIVLEFLPYIGAVVMVCLLSISAVASFDGVAHILMVPAAYIVISTIQASRGAGLTVSTSPCES